MHSLNLPTLAPYCRCPSVDKVEKLRQLFASYSFGKFVSKSHTQPIFDYIVTFTYASASRAFNVIRLVGVFGMSTRNKCVCKVVWS